jgi:putative phosphoribosyl transferase
VKLNSFQGEEESLSIPCGSVQLDGDLLVPPNAHGVVVFAHGSGSSRHSPRNRQVAKVLQDAGLGTLLMDLLTREEEIIDVQTRHLRFDVALLAERLGCAVAWLAQQQSTLMLNIGLFGASTGAGAALITAADHPDLIGAVVSRGGRPDLAGSALSLVKSPTLLIAGANDEPVVELNQQAQKLLQCQHELQLVPNATHLFEEQGALEVVSTLACDWFLNHLPPRL